MKKSSDFGWVNKISDRASKISDECGFFLLFYVFFVYLNAQPKH